MCIWIGLTSVREEHRKSSHVPQVSHLHVCRAAANQRTSFIGRTNKRQLPLPLLSHVQCSCLWDRTYVCENSNNSVFSLNPPPPPPSPKTREAPSPWLKTRDKVFIRIWPQPLWSTGLNRHSFNIHLQLSVGPKEWVDPVISTKVSGRLPSESGVFTGRADPQATARVLGDSSSPSDEGAHVEPHLINYLRTDGYRTELSIKPFQLYGICMWSSSGS